jgi:predicted MPP superfamily phosphohydrolase
MKKNAYIFFISLFIFTFQVKVLSQAPPPKGLWKFNDISNLNKAEIGNQLEPVGTVLLTTGPVEGKSAVKIGRGSYYKMKHGISPNGGGALVNEYTLQIDFRIPDLKVWRSFFQTSPTNSNDGECFINLSGYIGVQATGYSTYAVKPNEWYRLVISVKNGTHLKYYLDGHLIVNGFYQAKDGRFALDNTLLLFADNDGEDGEIDCAEVAIWDYALDIIEVKSLGDYGHAPRQLILVPYLQTPTSNSIYISWHDSTSTNTKVEYGTSPLLGQSMIGTSEVISSNYIWHTVKLAGLLPNTEYFYRVSSGNGISEIYSFRTQPTAGYNGKIRILMLSDTHADDTTMTVKIINEAKSKMQQLSGNNFQNNFNLVLHSGDMVVASSDITQWTEQYFAPLSAISPYIPIMTVPGNHEGEDITYYKYMKYDDVSAYPATDPLSERFWSFNIANTAFIGLNSNLTNSRSAHQLSWLDQKLKEIENNTGIDFVIIIVHHLPVSELWGEGMSDFGSVYVRNQVIPILKKYSKVVQLSYGHTHGFERGTIESEVNNPRNDFRIVCSGGGGGPIDYWGAFKNSDYPFIHISLDHYLYQIIEIDVAEKTFESFMYSLGNSNKSRNSQLMDTWYIKINQPSPASPIVNPPLFDFNKITFSTSEISSDSLMTVKVQIADNINFNKIFIDSMIHWKNIYGVDANFNPVNLNQGLDLTNLSFSNSLFLNEKSYYYRVKYRDHNLKWSTWSNTIEFNLPHDNDDNSNITQYDLMQNFPNPFNSETKIIYQIPQSGFISLRVYDILGNEIATLVNQEKRAGRYEAVFDSKSLSSGVYFYKILAGNYSQTKKFIIIK